VTRAGGPLNADVRWLVRALLEREKPVIAHLVARADLTVDISQLLGSPMDDGGMPTALRILWFGSSFQLDWATMRWSGP
jgi:hypothetical protein